MSKAAAQEPDSTSVEQLNEVVVQAVRAPKEAPFAVSKIDKKELQTFARSGQELPMMLSRTPGITAWTENGLGTGTTSLRIRGAGASRINVTLDGVSLNSPEDQCVFWANMNSYAYMLSNIQIQRGVGTSTNGDGAFGGTVALTMAAPSTLPYLDLTGSYGSYNTWNAGGNFSTGLMARHLILDGAYHHTGTDGYIHGTDGNSGSYYGGLTWLSSSGDVKVSYKNIGNYEHTGQAWNGVTAGNGDYSVNAYDGIRSYKDMYEAGLGRYNDLWEDFQPDWAGGWTTQRYQMADGTPWPRTTDNFWQTHHILNFAWDINDWWKLSVSPHYTRGYGYYDEFRYQNKLIKYGIPYFTDASGNKVKYSDFVRQKGLSQDTYGIVANVSYRKGAWDVVGGLSVQQFKGNHFGYLTYAGAALEGLMRLNTPIFDEQGGLRYRYYDSDASKLDASAFVKASYALSDAWSVFGDLQFRHVGYRTDGYNDKYIDNGDGTSSKHMLDIDVKYNFFNPKAGVNFSRDGHRAFASFAMSHREPERNNFTDNGKYPAPRAERLLDWEAGYQYDGRGWRAGATLYYMRYKDQLVQTGEASDIGEPLTTNIPDSYRLGAELTAGWDITRWLTVEGNAALSRNRLLDFDEVIEDWDDWKDNPDYALYHCDGNGDEARSFHHSDKSLAFSPSAILNGFVNVHFGDFRAVWHTGYVSRMYLDNSENELRSLPAYSLSDFSLGYTFRPRKVLKAIDLGVDFNNVFSARVAQSGWVYSAVCESYGHTPENRYYQLGFVPVAPLTVLGHITLRF